jgi:hypothetical protein
VVHRKYRLCTAPPLTAPWTRPATRPGGLWVLIIVLLYAGDYEYERSLLQLKMVGARLSGAAPGRSGPMLR